MKIEILPSAKASGFDGDVHPLWSAEDAKKAPALPDWAQGIEGEGEFMAKPGQMLSLRQGKGTRNAAQTPSGARINLIVGLGPAKDAELLALVQNYAGAVSALKGARAREVQLRLPAFPKGSKLEARHLPQLVGRLATQLLMSDYAFDRYKPKDEGPKPEVRRVALVVPAAQAAACEQALGPAIAIAEAANLTRSLQNEPANVATPAFVAAKASEMAKKSGVRCTVLGRKEMERLRMGALLAVGAGSHNEPKLVLLEYRGNPAKKGWDVAMVGKGITFDSGGISIKPSAKMDEMKFDKSGACATIGTLSACRKLGLKLNVVGVAALAENMPSGTAYRPGDILTACDGNTIEVLNTDAEGRVLLSDALAYTAKHYDPDVIVDFATLTGACVVALGDLASGLLTRDEELAQRLEGCGQACGERLWRLPFWPEYDEKVKSEIATVKNIGESGQAGATAGASFLKPFVGERPWAHIDIAGTANQGRPRAGLGAGGTGVGVRLMCEYLQGYKPTGKGRKKPSD